TCPASSAGIPSPSTIISGSPRSSASSSSRSSTSATRCGSALPHSHYPSAGPPTMAAFSRCFCSVGGSPSSSSTCSSEEAAMRRLARPALAFVAIGLLLYAGVYYWSERLVYRTGDSNPFFKIATLDTLEVDWVILGASHAMPLDFADFNAVMERETGLRIVNLAAQGTGPLYNRFALEQFLETHRTANVLYVLDSFAFRS